ncbi:MAG: glycosyltransferase, partial [Pedobacter sp.]
EQGSHHFMGMKNPSIISKINNFNPDAILVYGWAYYSHLKVLRHFKGKIPIWFRGDSHLLDSKPLWKKLARKALLTWVYSYIDKAFYVGKANKDYFEEFGLKENQLVFAPHAVDNERFSEDRNDEVDLFRQNLKIGIGEIVILFAGKLERKKNPELLLQAFLGLKMDMVHLLFVGNGELEESLKGAVESFDYAQDDTNSEKDSSIKNRIHFMDFQNQSYMPIVYQACDLFCLPSRGPNETWGLAVNEAMAAGKAILISDKVGCGEDLANESNGFIFNGFDSVSLQKCLRKVLNSDLNLMGQSSKQIISNWDFKHQVSAFIKTLYAS